MVKVGLVAADGMKLGCPPALAANRGRKHIDASRVGRGRPFGADGRGGEPPAQLRDCEPPAQLRDCAARRGRFVVAKPE
jgi:hypothetical protein